MFRHSYGTLLRADGTDVKVQSELLRHSNIGTTLNLYTQAVSEQNGLHMGWLLGNCWQFRQL
jgi:site-specific recombinase XerD